MIFVLAHFDRLHDWQRCHSCFISKPKLSKINHERVVSNSPASPLTCYRVCSAQQSVRIKSDLGFANGQRPTRQYFPPGSGCLTSLWPLAVALSSDETPASGKILQRNRKI